MPVLEAANNMLACNNCLKTVPVYFGIRCPKCKSHIYCDKACKEAAHEFHIPYCEEDYPNECVIDPEDFLGKEIIQKGIDLYERWLLDHANDESRMILCITPDGNVYKTDLCDARSGIDALKEFQSEKPLLRFCKKSAIPVWVRHEDHAHSFLFPLSDQ